MNTYVENTIHNYEETLDRPNIIPNPMHAMKSYVKTIDSGTTAKMNELIDVVQYVQERLRNIESTFKNLSGLSNIPALQESLTQVGSRIREDMEELMQGLSTDVKLELINRNGEANILLKSNLAEIRALVTETINAAIGSSTERISNEIKQAVATLSIDIDRLEVNINSCTNTIQSVQSDIRLMENIHAERTVTLNRFMEDITDALRNGGGHPDTDLASKLDSITSKLEELSVKFDEISMVDDQI